MIGGAFFVIRGTLNNHRKQGKFIGAFPSYGFFKDPEDHHKLIIDGNAVPTGICGGCFFASFDAYTKNHSPGPPFSQTKFYRITLTVSNFTPKFHCGI